MPGFIYHRNHPLAWWLVALLAAAVMRTPDARPRAGRAEDELGLNIPVPQFSDQSDAGQLQMAIGDEAIPGGPTTARLHKHTRRQARAALLAAVPNHLASAALIDDSPLAAAAADDGTALAAAAAVGPAAVCSDKNSLAASSYPEDFRIIVTFQTTNETLVTSSCTAFRIAPRHLGTAGHCIFRKSLGGWAYTVDVYSGATVCSGTPRTTAGLSMATTQRWMNKPDDGNTSPWDMAVIKTADALPDSNYVLGQYTGPKMRNVMITGYPSQNSESAACNSPAYAGGCRQFSSKGKMWSALNGGMYRSNAVDFCKGHSGSAVWDTDLKIVVGVVGGGGGSSSSCMNFIVPQLNATNANAKCEGASGGASLACLRTMAR